MIVMMIVWMVDWNTQVGHTYGQDGRWNMQLFEKKAEAELCQAQHSLG